METKIESRVGTIAAGEEHIYNFISDFNNFKQFIPADKIQDYQSTTDTCRFSVPNMGQVGLKIAEKTPFNTIKVTGDGMANQQFMLWVQLKQVADNDTRVKVTLKADLNPMLKMMVSKPLQNFVDKLVEGMERMRF